MDHRLLIQELTKPVQFRSNFVASDSSYRSLTPPELGLMFGLNATLSHNSTLDCYPFPLVQILDATLHPLLQQTERSSVAQPQLHIPTPSIPTMTYLPSLQSFLPLTWSEVSSTVDVAAKSDDAATEFRHWDERITLVLPHTRPVLPSLRRLFLTRQFHNIYLEFRAYLFSKYGSHCNSLLKEAQSLNRGEIFSLHSNTLEFSKDWAAGTHVLSCYNNSSYFGWERGSALIFWRWHPLYINAARDGFSPFLIKQPPVYLKRPRPFPDKERRLFSTKTIKFIEKAYIIPSSTTHPIVSVVDYFAVPKGDSDIRPVFNGTTCGLNAVAWAPNFWLPTAMSIIDNLHYNYQVVDLDLGEIFNNFILHSSLHAYSDIDLTQFRDLLNTHFLEQRPFPKRILYKWARDWMGLKPSPFWAARFYYLMEEFMIGDHRDKKNCFRWDQIILNLPGSFNFNSTLPFVIKWDSESKLVAASIRAYVDDLRVVAATRELSWQAARQTASMLQYLGSQDASRKRRLDNGPWAGTMLSTSNGVISKSVTKSKWEKGKRFITELVEEIKLNPSSTFEYKRLEKFGGSYATWL